MFDLNRWAVAALFAAGLITFGSMNEAEAGDTYTIDPGHSSVTFKVKHFGIGYTHGRFRKLTGQMVVDKKASKSSVKINIEAASVYTNDKKRDKHLKSPDFFNVKQFPTVSFVSSKVAKAGKGYKVTGKLTLHGVTKTVTVKMKKVGEGKDPYGKFRIGFEGSLSIKRSAYNMKKMIGPAGDKISLTIAIEGIKG